jgi:hypothetical protein
MSTVLFTALRNTIGRQQHIPIFEERAKCSATHLAAGVPRPRYGSTDHCRSSWGTALKTSGPNGAKRVGRH